MMEVFILPAVPIIDNIFKWETLETSREPSCIMRVDKIISYYIGIKLFSEVDLPHNLGWP